MKYWTPLLIAQIAICIITWRSVFCQSDNPLVTNAQTIDDLQHVLGPNYKLFVAAYWRYLVSSCQLLATRMAEDIGNGRLDKYCMFLNKCPMLYPTQSCLIQISVYSTSWACCTEPQEVDQATPATPVTSTQLLRDVSKTGSTTFTFRDQQTCNYGRVFPSGKIYGGTEARQGEFPWTVMLLRNDLFLCEGVVVDEWHILTTAHCFDAHIDSHRYDIIAGKYTFSLDETDPTEQKVAVISFIRHEHYDKDNTWNDIALLELARPLEFNDAVLPACLPSPTDKLEQYCTVTGWGKTDGDNPPRVLMKVELEAYNRTQCFDEFKDTATDLDRYLHDGAICAANGKMGQKDACKGDSGSPLMCVKATQTSAAWFVFGIVSNGNSCALPGEPGIYVSVQYYLDWINATIHSLY